EGRASPRCGGREAVDGRDLGQGCPASAVGRGRGRHAALAAIVLAAIVLGGTVLVGGVPGGGVPGAGGAAGRGRGALDLIAPAQPVLADQGGGKGNVGGGAAITAGEQVAAAVADVGDAPHGDDVRRVSRTCLLFGS